jgi:tRNA (guanine-N7-)-methyltransferase
LEQPPHRLVFGRRRGHALRPAQRSRIERLLPRVGVTLPNEGTLDLEAVFGRAQRAIWLEIGFGGGEHLAEQAERHPDIGFIGCEYFENGIEKLLAQIETRRLRNVRIYRDDARLLMAALPPVSIARVFVLFPDPWPKRRHHKRRIVSREALDQFAAIMCDFAELLLATDDGDYLSWMLERVTDHAAFDWMARRPADWRDPPADWVPTRYEGKARAAGRRPAFLVLRRRARSGG